MDKALDLKILTESEKTIDKNCIDDYLLNSELVTSLTREMPDKPLEMVWRLIALSEIPYSCTLGYTKTLIEKVYVKLATSYGFSLSGDEKGFLPCYNAMIASALCRLNRENDVQVRNAIDWINNYQPMNRGKEMVIPGFNFKKYGGCFEQTPCYIGLAKSVFALQIFSSKTKNNNVEQKLQSGISYLLEHSFYKRLKHDIPITSHITDISFPETYHLNVIELIRFAKNAGLIQHEKTKDLIQFIISKQLKTGKWKNNYTYKAKGYIPFDKGKHHSEWTTYIIKQAIETQYILQYTLIQH